MAVFVVWLQSDKFHALHVLFNPHCPCAPYSHQQHMQNPSSFYQTVTRTVLKTVHCANQNAWANTRDALQPQSACLVCVRWAFIVPHMARRARRFGPIGNAELSEAFMNEALSTRTFLTWSTLPLSWTALHLALGTRLAPWVVILLQAPLMRCLQSLDQHPWFQGMMHCMAMPTV